METAIVRALFTATRVDGLPSPYDVIQVKVHYPARPSGDDTERLTGAVPPDATDAPWPVVVLIHGVNVGPEGYRWLVEKIVPHGFAVVTYTMVGELYPPGTFGLTPGIDLDAVRPDAYGTRPTCTALQPILARLAELNVEGALAGLLDLDRVALGGHSAGATMALQNARRSYLPGIAGAFGYAGHTLASKNLGWPSEDPLAVDGDVPVLIMGGTRDGIIARSADRYGLEGHTRDPIVRTFEDAVPAGAGHAYLAIVEGANHQTFVHPHDATVARGFLDLEPTVDEVQARSLIAELTIAFLRAHVRGSADARADLDALLDSPMLARSERR